MMKKPTASMPQGIAGANAAYYQRLTQLAQESQQRWMELGRRLADQHTNNTLSTLSPLQHTGDWQSIAPALGEMTRKQWQAQLEASQAITHAALQEQAALTAGLGEAMSGWFKLATGGGIAPAPFPMTQIWTAMSDQMAAACAAMRDANQPGDRHDG
ncbi:hypothetical protein C4E15_01315 [Achromobacter spanius]|uniref:Phasin domain-containing protein n=2 Tax=Alcaligenaceae TaxID=506 RepID=A0A2S5GY85_9BURK|nr:hypothetical protein [Achromobacter sp. B7]AYD66700.1 hypothetical protein DVB37_24335 [Achromobacter sp. B7]MDX3988445.1 hypothetical protein [Achromobacter sp.]PPA77956.1 hypothetical protein C4E15_01315 [Achromobacter spanius]